MRIAFFFEVEDDQLVSHPVSQVALPADGKWFFRREAQVDSHPEFFRLRIPLRGNSGGRERKKGIIFGF